MFRRFLGLTTLFLSIHAHAHAQDILEIMKENAYEMFKGCKVSRLSQCNREDKFLYERSCITNNITPTVNFLMREGLYRDAENVSKILFCFKDLEGASSYNYLDKKCVDNFLTNSTTIHDLSVKASVEMLQKIKTCPTSQLPNAYLPKKYENKVDRVMYGRECVHSYAGNFSLFALLSENRFKAAQEFANFKSCIALGKNSIWIGQMEVFFRKACLDKLIDRLSDSINIQGGET